MNTFRVIAPVPGSSVSGVGKIALWLLIGTVAVFLARWWGESSMATRIEARQAISTRSMATVYATPIPTPTPIAPTIASAQVITLDTGLGFSAEYDMQTVPGGVRLTDPDGDLWLCDALPASIADWQSCKYAGTIQGD